MLKTFLFSGGLLMVLACLTYLSWRYWRSDKRTWRYVKYMNLFEMLAAAFMIPVSALTLNLLIGLPLLFSMTILKFPCASSLKGGTQCAADWPEPFLSAIITAPFLLTFMMSFGEIFWLLFVLPLAMATIFVIQRRAKHRA